MSKTRRKDQRKVEFNVVESEPRRAWDTRTCLDPLYEAIRSLKDGQAVQARLTFSDRIYLYHIVRTRGEFRVRIENHGEVAHIFKKPPEIVANKRAEER